MITLASFLAIVPITNKNWFIFCITISYSKSNLMMFMFTFMLMSWNKSHIRILSLLHVHFPLWYASSKVAPETEVQESPHFGLLLMLQRDNIRTITIWLGSQLFRASGKVYRSWMTHNMWTTQSCINRRVRSCQRIKISPNK